MGAAVSGHTPGPWTVGYRALNVVGGGPKGAFKVCDIRGWGYLTGMGHGALGLPPAEAEAIQIANARLIAAAPDLLAALKDVSRIARAASVGITGNQRRLAAAEAAIAKAEGRKDLRTTISTHDAPATD